ncbi:Maf family nucleotide pyrophosphatase [Moheibacter sp.]|uniref:Maf family nucleotide pyrophosphatase n=1 Tax=Moheibacter sp. TaxID=1965316 RepID=UPI003C780267
MLCEIYSDKKFLLASQSPRRQELLKGLDIDFEIVKIEADESFPEHLVREEITEFISKTKSESFRPLDSDEILITADTLVWLENEILGKPKNQEEAIQMLSLLSDSTHEVFTSVTVKSIRNIITFSDTTQVTFSPISEDEINYYIENYKPFDKAGAYGIQEWIGFAKIFRIQGCYYNVMGLPLHKLYSVLESNEF